MLIDKKEAIRYMGFGKNTPDERTLNMLEECVEEVMRIAEPRHTFRRFRLKIDDDDIIQVEKLCVQSHNLARNLRGCEEVIFFAATLGREVDMLLNRYVKLSISKAAVFQATAAAAIEAYCNECQKNIEAELASEGLYLRPRFSPGYGDLPLTIQGEFLDILRTDRTVGIVLSEGGVMIPEKSVTAIMGISNENNKCHIEGCENCSNVDCAYRR